ncbi:MAG: histidine kinase [Clostridia bacterium]|nr:histidine kinase [Clostridia bacterium]
MVKKSYLEFAGILLLILLAIFLLWFNNSTSMQATPALIAQVYFDGEYRIADGEWQKIVKGEHIPSTKGDVTLRGNLHMLDPEGGYVGIYRGDLPIAFYTDHINLTFMEGDSDPYVIDMENPLYGSSSCGVNWTAHYFTSESDETIEILIHNPHSFGNENAIDEMLSTMAIWTGIEFEKDVLSNGEPQRNVGMLLMLVSLVFLGIALFSSLIHIKSNRIIWLLGLVVLFAGAYIAYSANGVSFWSESIVSNTTVLGLSMMFYMLFLSISISYFLKATKPVGEQAVILLAVAYAVFFVLPIVTDVLFYDMWAWWVAVQTLANAVLLFCLVKEFISNEGKERWLYMAASLPLFAFAVDAVGTWLGAWQGGVISQYVFVALFVVAMVMVLKLIPHSINASTKAKELEMEKIVLNAELAESRISTMMSQIRPHFIYNTLGSIEQLCKLDPPKAGDLVHNFAKYLRGNFGELDNPKPIRMSQEMEHVHHYISIENVRFPDMTFMFEMKSEDFQIPALTVQPIVENAIKHGLMKLPRGGTIHVVSYETDTDYCISVVDDGVGFDTSVLIDERKHVGLRNIRERLKVMVNGKLEIESTVGVGTKVLVTIPKEVNQ